MNKKNKILSFALGLAVSAISILLWIFCVPNSLPLLFDINEKVVTLGSKWYLFFMTILPTIFCLVFCFSKNKDLQFVFKTLFVLSFYELFIILISVLTGNIPSAGEKPEIPLTCYLLLPIAVIILVYGIKLKHQPYKSKVGINFKCTKETEFIWKQTHFYAQKVFSVTGLIMFIFSATLSFFHFAIVVFAIDVISIAICLIIVYNYSHSIYKKYISMKTKRDNLEKTEAKK